MKVHYITVATKPHPILNNIIKRVENNKEKLYILGMQENRLIGWNAKGNFGVKLKEVKNYIDNDKLDNEDIIIFTDAYDVIYTGNQEIILDRYLNMKKPIIFGSETECNPDPERETDYLIMNEKFPYLNSGMYIGKVWAIRECMKEYIYNDKDDDQRYWTSKFFERPDLISLDYKNELFLNTYGIEIEDVRWNRQEAYYNLKNPQFIHVNGPDKGDLNRFI